MNGRLAGVAFPIIFGGYLLFSNLTQSTLFSQGPRANYHTVLSAFGAFLLVLGVIFLYRNLK
jgi:hypothetical protein